MIAALHFYLSHATGVVGIEPPKAHAAVRADPALERDRESHFEIVSLPDGADWARLEARLVRQATQIVREAVRRMAAKPPAGA